MHTHCKAHVTAQGQVIRGQVSPSILFSSKVSLGSATLLPGLPASGQLFCLYLHLPVGMLGLEMRNRGIGGNISSCIWLFTWITGIELRS